MHKVKGYYIIRNEGVDTWDAMYVLQCGPFNYEAALNELQYFRQAKPETEFRIIYTDIVGEMLIA